MSKGWNRLFTFPKDSNRDLERDRDSVELQRRGDQDSLRSQDSRNENRSRFQQQPAATFDQNDDAAETTREGKFVIKCKFEFSARRTTYKTQSPKVAPGTGHQLAATRSDLTLPQHDVSGGPSKPESDEEDDEKAQSFDNIGLLGDILGGDSDSYGNSQTASHTTSSVRLHSNDSFDTNFGHEKVPYAPDLASQRPTQHPVPTYIGMSEEKQVVDDDGEGSDTEQSSLGSSDIEGLSLLLEDFSAPKPQLAQNIPEMPSSPSHGPCRTRTPLYPDDLINQSELMPYSASRSSQASPARRPRLLRNELDADEMKYQTDWQYLAPVSSVFGVSQTDLPDTLSSRSVASKRDLPPTPALTPSTVQSNLSRDRTPLSTYSSPHHLHHESSSSQFSNISFDQMRGEPLTPASSIASDSKAQTLPAQLGYDRGMPACCSDMMTHKCSTPASDIYARTVSPPFPMRFGGPGIPLLQSRSETMLEPRTRSHTAQDLSRGYQGYPASRRLHSDGWHELPDIHFAQTTELAGTQMNRNLPKLHFSGNEPCADETHELPA